MPLLYQIMEHTQIIILAGGKGIRMGGDLPKAITPLGNQTMVEYVLDTVESLATSHKPIVVVGYKADMVKEILGNRADYAFQDEPQGTGHAVMCALPFITPEIRNVVILYADQPLVSQQTIQRLVELHRDNQSKLSIATATIFDEVLFNEQFYNFGRIVRDSEGKISAIVEAKDADEEQKNIREVNPAYFCCDKEWMIKELSNIENNNAQGEYYLTDLVKIAFGMGMEIPSVNIEEKEALGANTPEQLQVLSSYL